MCGALSLVLQPFSDCAQVYTSRHASCSERPSQVHVIVAVADPGCALLQEYTYPTFAQDGITVWSVLVRLLLPVRGDKDRNARPAHVLPLLGRDALHMLCRRLSWFLWACLSQWRFWLPSMTLKPAVRLLLSPLCLLVAPHMQSVLYNYSCHACRLCLCGLLRQWDHAPRQVSDP